ncbi:MAG: SAM-dependent methyltransferase [bacterium]
MTNEILHGSFRDPNGNIFIKNGRICRSIKKTYQQNYDFLIDSGLYGNLISNNLLIPHLEANHFDKDENEYKIIEPEIIPFISYPYEWCFDQLKDSALTTLEIQKTALEYNMILKDASAYNLQFKNGRPILIDTLSFEIYDEGSPWIAYRQFCENFLAPLALMSYVDCDLLNLLKTYLDGIPLSTAKNLLHYKARFNMSLLLNIYLQNLTKTISESKNIGHRTYFIKKNKLTVLMNQLEESITKLKVKKSSTVWTNYYDIADYTENGMNHKKLIVESYLQETKPAIVWDLGANDGRFSKLASRKGILTVSIDKDHSAVEENYLISKSDSDGFILPLVIDITNPSPKLGFKLEERMSLIDRGPADTVIALGLIHHLIITNNIPINFVASFFNAISRFLIIEFIPEYDSKAKMMLERKKYFHKDLTQERFEAEFKKFFNILKITKIKDSERILYLLKNHDN